MKVVHLPKGFLQTLSPKCLTEFVEKAENFKFNDYMDHNDYYSMGYPESRPSKCLKAMGDVLLIEFSGFVFSEDLKNPKLKETFELHKKAKELDELKRSLSSISGALKDVVK